MTESFETIKNYLDQILVLISVIISILAIYNKLKGNMISMIAKFISLAEENTDLSGSEKMDLVLSWLKDITPRLFRVIFNENTWNQIVQNIYDDMKKYKDNYIRNKTGMNTKEVINVITEILDDPQAPCCIDEDRATVEAYEPCADELYNTLN